MPRKRRQRKRNEGPSRGSLVLLFAICVILGGGSFSSSFFAGYPAAIQQTASVGFTVGAAVIAFVVWRMWVRRRRYRIECLEDLLALSPAGFEAAVAELLRDSGYRSARQVGGSGDLAADIVGRDEEGRSVVVQCKRYKPGHRVGSPDLQQFIGMIHVHHRAERGVYVTTSEFTAPARSLARKHGIELIDGASLTTLALRVRKTTGSKPLVRA